MEQIDRKRSFCQTLLRRWTLRFGLVMLLSGVGISLPNVTTVAVAQGERVVHIVQRGESLSKIAARYGTSYPVLARYNNLSNPDHLYVGQQIWIPITNAPAPTPTPGRWATPSRALTHDPPSYNRPQTERPQTERPQTTVSTPRVVSPLSRSGRTGEVAYSVRRGDNLSSIAAFYGVNASSIMARNNLSSSVIYVGQRLIIPTGNYAANQGPAVQNDGSRIQATPTPYFSSRPTSTSTPDRMEEMAIPPSQPSSPLPTPGS